MTLRILLSMAVLTIFAACATVGGLLNRADAPTAVDPTDPCGAQNYSALLGASLAAVTLPADLNDIVISPGSVVTTDYDPSRLRIDVDENGTIVGLSCG